MNIVKQSSQRRPNPKTLVTTACMNTIFDTGHSMTKWPDGTVFYHNKNGGALNPKSGAKLIAAMNEKVS